MQDVHRVAESGAAATGIVGAHYSANKKQRKDYTFWRHFSETPCIILGCPAPLACHVLAVLMCPCQGKAANNAVHMTAFAGRLLPHPHMLCLLPCCVQVYTKLQTMQCM